MKIHEFQAKELLRGFGVAVPRSRVIDQPDDAADIAREFGGRAVVKAQIHAGGRGQGGGVKLAASPEAANQLARQILGMTLVTHQTGPEGRLVRRVLIEETATIVKELYLGIVLDRASGMPVFMASAAGGMEIEEVAAKDPDAIRKVTFAPDTGLLPYQARELAFALGLPAAALNSAVKIMTSLARAYTALDCTLAEINPLILTADNQVMALDAKITLDDNALYRHPELKALRDLNEEDPLEVEASLYGLNYIKLDGNVACMVNGAGLAMATMDIIKYAGGSPANFLDVGGGANSEQVRHAFQILLKDPSVKAVLINIFGGILRCDTLATGVVEAARAVDLKLPLVIRMEGTNVEQGRAILAASGLAITVAGDMRDAAKKVVAAAAGKK
ncbi:MAG TPA: ADP-forming succinate--CoA ligase subunit beta [Terriglobales bacterium]|nr:ADP-forming succinate--CoA ligase subunit beta [Terriglobales bacterium]